MGEFHDGTKVDDDSYHIQYQALSPDQISQKMFEIVDDVNAVFQV